MTFYFCIIFIIRNLLLRKVRLYAQFKYIWFLFYFNCRVILIILISNQYSIIDKTVKYLNL